TSVSLGAVTSCRPPIVRLMQPSEMIANPVAVARTMVRRIGVVPQAGKEAGVLAHPGGPPHPSCRSVFPRGPGQARPPVTSRSRHEALTGVADPRKTTVARRAHAPLPRRWAVLAFRISQHEA